LNTIYFAAMTASKDLAIQDGPYEHSKVTVIKRQFQFDLWKVKPESGRWIGKP